MKNILQCVIPGIDVALCLQLWLALEDEHGSLSSRIHFYHDHNAEKRTRGELLDLGIKTHRLRYAMHDAWQETLKLRRN